jgi:hypothetical protein
MMRFVWRALALSVAITGFAGCDSGDMHEGVPEKPEYKVPVMPDSMKGAGMAPKVIPKAGEPGTGGAPVADPK